MQPLEMIIGGLLIAIAVGCIIGAFANEAIALIGAAVILAGAGAFSLQHGIHMEHAKFKAKHEAILRDLRKQGFHVRYDSVFAVGGNYLYGTEVDLPAGGCWFSFNATKLAGVWHATLPQAKGNGVVVLTPADVKTFATAC